MSAASSASSQRLAKRSPPAGWRGSCWGIGMLVALPWRQALVTWAVAAMSAGVLHIAREVPAHVRMPARTPEARPRLGHLFHAFVAWPTMRPEAVEYLLAEPGVPKRRSWNPGSHLTRPKRRDILVRGNAFEADGLVDAGSGGWTTTGDGHGIHQA